MNARLILCIVMGVFTAHLAVFMLLAQFRPKPKLVVPQPPTFKSVAETVIDEATGEKTTYREITVSTQLAGEKNAEIRNGQPQPAAAQKNVAVAESAR